MVSSRSTAFEQRFVVLARLYAVMIICTKFWKPSAGLRIVICARVVGRVCHRSVLVVEENLTLFAPNARQRSRARANGISFSMRAVRQWRRQPGNSPGFARAARCLSPPLLPWPLVGLASSALSSVWGRLLGHRLAVSSASQYTLNVFALTTSPESASITIVKRFALSLTIR